ncbi:type 1 glutamine amidotransferase [Aliiroseovarius sp. KMU-50]|uniref:Type 1 glutamine amidotransferase n=1 Tax=Aliiroseovarius salicola TaxID=3009082 RepID=A0ABT4W153_9RHOB|nr:type 1 glutamine amidotransferase [Aliiroseovarius sp. KMU-50]MDA5094237.1 type 1 glutamine amidotransferase [Aliiroseovarius sp. KMU-50]
MTNTDESEFAQAHPTEGDKWLKLIAPKRPNWIFSTFSVKDHHFPNNEEQFDGWIVTGSPASVHDAEKWIEDLLALLRRITLRRSPLFGAGFGHQATALALGGCVEENPNGWIFGSTEMIITAPPPWMRAKRIWQYGAHIEQVTELPDEAKAIMSHKGCQIGGYVIGDYVFTTQNHPEMSDKFFAGLVESSIDSKPLEIVEKARKSLPLGADNGVFADWIIRFFERDFDPNDM